MKTNWMLSTALLVLPLTLLSANSSEAKAKKETSKKATVAKKSKKGPKKISISFESKKSKGRGPASVSPVEPILEKQTVAELETSKSGSCKTSQDSSGWHLPVEDEASSCTLSGRNKPTDPSRGLGFIVNKKFNIFSMTEGEVIGVVGELMGCKVIVAPERCPAGKGAKSCDITYTIPNVRKNANNECEIPGIKVGTKLRACQKIAEVRPSKSFNLVRIETSAKAPLQEVLASYKKSSSQRKQCSRDKTLLASTLY